MVDIDCYQHKGQDVPRVSRIARLYAEPGDSDRLADWACYEAIRAGERGAWRVVRDEAASVGTEAHALIEAVLSESDIEFEPTQKALAACRSWVEWRRKKNRFEIVATEHQLTCSSFGGTIDAIAKIGGRQFVIDWKTGSKIRLSDKLQAAAYVMLCEDNGIDVDAALIVRIGKRFDVVEAQEVEIAGPELNAYMSAFVNLLDIHAAISSVKKARAKTIVKQEVTNV